MTRDELERQIGHHVAFAMTGNRMPDMGGDTRNRLCPMQRRDCDHAVEAIIDHPRIARAITLLDRIGDEAADALINGTAAVTMIGQPDAPIILEPGQTWVPTSPKAKPRTIMWVGQPKHRFNPYGGQPCVGYAIDPTNVLFPDVGHDSYLSKRAFLAWVRNHKARLAAGRLDRGGA